MNYLKITDEEIEEYKQLSKKQLEKKNINLKQRDFFHE